MVLLGDEGLVEICSVCLPIVLILTSGAWFASNVPWAHKSFYTNQMVLQGDEGPVELYSVRLEIVLILTQDRCTVCT
jgi:hypothetical protein